MKCENIEMFVIIVVVSSFDIAFDVFFIDASFPLIWLRHRSSRVKPQRRHLEGREQAEMLKLYIKNIYM